MSCTLRLALTISVIFHLALGAYFLITRPLTSPLKSGTIAVDLIESVPHELIEDPHLHPGKKTTARENSPPAAFRTVPSVGQSVGGAVRDSVGDARQADLYIQTVSRMINARKIYPRRAVEREEEGRVVVGVTLDREGHVVASRIEEPSPFDSLNQAALDTIKSVGIFPAIPEDVPDPIHLHIPLIFKIESR